MTTTYINFAPNVSANPVFQFQATLDGTNYSVVLTWNHYGLRYYVNLYTLDGALVFCLPLISSPPRGSATLTTHAENYMAMVSNPAGLGNGTYVVSPSVAVGTTVGAIVGSTLVLSSPALATGSDAMAMFSNDVNIAGGYFDSTSLVYRATTAQFEVADFPPLPSTTPKFSSVLPSSIFGPSSTPPFYPPPPSAPFPPGPPPTMGPPLPFITDRSSLDSGDVLVGGGGGIIQPPLPPLPPPPTGVLTDDAGQHVLTSDDGTPLTPDSGGTTSDPFQLDKSGLDSQDRL